MLIAQRQNTQPYLELAKAFKNVYSKAKVMGSTRVAVAIVSVLTATFVVLAFPKWANALFVVGVILTFVCEGPLEALENSKKTEAANIQEQFDVGLFELRWNRVIAGEKVRPESIAREAAEFNNKQSIRDWYFDTGAMPRPLNVLLCQRESLAWDARQRRHFAGLTTSLTLLLIGTGVGVSLWKHQSLLEYLASMLTPSIPAILQGYNASRAHTENAAQKERLIGIVQGFWDEWMAGAPAPSGEDCRAVQDMIYMLRKEGPMTPDLWHNQHRNQYEQDMRMALTKYRQDAEQRTEAHSKTGKKE